MLSILYFCVNLFYLNNRYFLIKSKKNLLCNRRKGKYFAKTERKRKMDSKTRKARKKKYIER